VAVHAIHETLEDDLLWDSADAPASRRLLAAALRCFAERGYHGTTTRQIANEAGLSPGAVYVHYRSKAELLHRISRTGHVAALETLEDANDPTITDPHDRVERIVRAFASWHATHHRLARVVQYELGSLPAEHRHEMMGLRNRCQAHVVRELTDGVESGAFGPIDIEGAAVAILSLCIDIGRWYGPGSERSPDDLGALYSELVGRSLRA
jgi:AcrR family transcriptional regulator